MTAETSFERHRYQPSDLRELVCVKMRIRQLVNVLKSRNKRSKQDVFNKHDVFIRSLTESRGYAAF